MTDKQLALLLEFICDRLDKGIDVIAAELNEAENGLHIALSPLRDVAEWLDATITELRS